ncbi:hypothetical protein ACP70R_028624 [Stipagrostis hirtigluma subsp. patula]
MSRCRLQSQQAATIPSLQVAGPERSGEWELGDFLTAGRSSRKPAATEPGDFLTAGRSSTVASAAAAAALCGRE